MNLIDERYGRLTVIEGPLKEKGRVKWACKCDCGNEKAVQQTHLRSGTTQSCGCLQKERASEASKTHGLKNTPLYATWKNIRQRCNNPNVPSYKNYGGRGINICDEWNDYKNFYGWCINNGYKSKLQIDRIDNNGNYEPSNCRFVEVVINNRNRRITVKVEGLCIREISDKYNVNYGTIRSRYYEAKSKGIKPTINMLIASQS